MATAHIVGSINRDIVAFVDRHPAPGETILGKRWAAFPGGKGANQAVAVARLGGSVRMIGCVGDDSFGADMRAFLAAEGVDTSRIATAPAVATGIALITVDAWAQNSITVISGANASWPRAPQLDIAPGDAVVCQLEVPLPIIIDAFRQARGAGATTVLNPAPFQPLPDELRALVDILILNEIELAQMTDAALATPAEVREAVGKLTSTGIGTVIATLGAQGALLATPDGMDMIDGHTVAARDTTGAGDCFVGAFVTEILLGAAPHAATAFANRAAALSVTRDGAAVSFPQRAELG